MIKFLIKKYYTLKLKYSCPEVSYFLQKYGDNLKHFDFESNDLVNQFVFLEDYLKYLQSFATLEDVSRV